MTKDEVSRVSFQIGDPQGWRELELAARAQVAADLDVLEATPLEFGAHICWSECRLGGTNGFTPLHRAGLTQFGHAYTTCGELIPAPVRWLPLSPAIIRTRARCQDCEAAYAAHTAKERSA